MVPAIESRERQYFTHGSQLRAFFGVPGKPCLRGDMFLIAQRLTAGRFQPVKTALL
ncbi:MAG TPA: hypothetical protein VHW72_17725 [Candidatus Angelobacter sp.]|jgi:hypothetical protein|nr:hypothetical protein [Candidatus Angelobacter sp.]